MKTLALAFAAVALIAACNAAAQSRTAWAHKSGLVRTDGAIVLRTPSNPTVTRTAAQNPTAANVQPAANIATQPPLLIQKTLGNRWSLYYTDRAIGIP